MEKTKEITLTLQKAIEYYNSNNKNLKEIALMFYDKEDLAVSTYDNICTRLYNSSSAWYIIGPKTDKYTGLYYKTIDGHDNYYIQRHYQTDKDTYFSSHDEKFLKHIGVLIKIKNIADYFNDFRKCDFGCEINCPYIMKPKTLPTMILFKNISDANKAYNILTDEDKKYLNY